MSVLPTVLLLLGMAVLTGAELMSGKIADAVQVVVSAGCLIVAIIVLFGWRRTP